MNITVEQYKGFTMLGKGDTDHVVVMDAKDEGGRSLGSTPMELLVMSLGGCSLMDVVHTLEKMKHNIDKISVGIKAERADTYPMKLVSLEFTYYACGDMPKEKLEKAVALSQEKYCSAMASLNPDIKIVNTFQIN
jgi:putative redox protein